MTVFRICALIGLALWVGGLSLFIGVIIPTAFRTFQKEEATRFLDALFQAVDRWALVWSAVTVVALCAFFLNHPLHPRSLVLEIPVGMMFGMTFYAGVVLHPQIHELKRKINLPEFQGTAHQETMRFSFKRFHQRSVQIHVLILTLGYLSLGLAPRFLR